MNIGDQFGEWTVLALIPHHKNPLASCRCVCGVVRQVQRGALRAGKSTSCGCIGIARGAAARRTHGYSGASTYKAWQAMQSRCSNPKDPSFKNYGARGICVLWASFEEFLADMGPAPAGMTIERVDTNGNYSKDNCCWADWSVQSSNKRVSKRWIINGVEYRSSTLAAQALGVDRSTISARCCGRKVGSKYYPAWDGYSARMAYPEAA